MRALPGAERQKVKMWVWNRDERDVSYVDPWYGEFLISSGKAHRVKQGDIDLETGEILKPRNTTLHPAIAKAQEDIRSGKVVASSEAPERLEGLENRVGGIESKLDKILDNLLGKTEQEQPELDGRVCEECDFIAKTPAGLKAHITRKHGN
jgi:hypothetical protein